MSQDEDEAGGSRIESCSVRYIKLGSSARWEAAAIDGGTLEWGSEIDPDHLSRQCDWYPRQSPATKAKKPRPY